jgi:hypothetical protein
MTTRRGKQTNEALKDHVEPLTLVVKGKMSDACGLIRDRREELVRNYDDFMTTTHDHMAEASRLYREAVDKHHVATLQMTMQSGAALAQNLKAETQEVKDKILSPRVVPELKLDDKELGFVKQLKHLQAEHVRPQASKNGAVEQLNTSREVNREASQVIADLETKIKFSIRISSSWSFGRTS